MMMFLRQNMAYSKSHNKRILRQPLRGLDGFFARSSLQKSRKCVRYAPNSVVKTKLYDE